MSVCSRAHGTASREPPGASPRVRPDTPPSIRCSGTQPGPSPPPSLTCSPAHLPPPPPHPSTLPHHGLAHPPPRRPLRNGVAPGREVHRRLHEAPPRRRGDL